MIKKLSLSLLLITAYAHSMEDFTQKLCTAIERSSFSQVEYLTEKPSLDYDARAVTTSCAKTMKKRTQGLPYNSFGTLFTTAGTISFVLGACNEYRRAYGNYQKNADTEVLFGFGDACFMWIGTQLLYWGITNHHTRQAYKDAAAIKQLLITRGFIDAQEAQTIENNSAEDAV